MKRDLDHLALADTEAAERLQRHLEGTALKPDTFQVDRAVREIIEALCVEISFGRTLADGIGRMLANGTPETLDKYLSMVKTAAGRGPTLAGILTKHLVPVLTSDDEDLVGRFEQTIAIMLKKGTYTLKAPLEALSFFIEAGEWQSAHAFLDLLATTYALDLTYNRSLYLTHTLPRAVKGFPVRRRHWQIQGLSKIIETDVRLTDAYLQGLTSGLGLLPEKELNAFLHKAILRYRKDSELGTRFISLESQQAKEICQECQVAVPLSAVRSNLERYLRARTGCSIPVRRLSALNHQTPTQTPKSPLSHCTGQAIYLPEEMDLMESREDNGNLYKLLVRLEAGAIEFGCYELDAEKTLDRAGLEPLSGTSGPAPNETDLAFFLRYFDHPKMALDLFTIFEHARVAHQVKRHYPGLSRRLLKVFTDKDLHLRTGHTVGGTFYALYRCLVLEEKRPSDPETGYMAQEINRRLNHSLQAFPQQSVQTSALLTVDVYPELVRILSANGNLPYTPLLLPFGRRMEPALFNPDQNPTRRLSASLKKTLAEQDVFVYRSDIEELITAQNGQISPADLRSQFIRHISPGTGSRPNEISDSDLAALICETGLAQTATEEDGAEACRYREWNFCIADYLPDHVRVMERRIPEADPAFYRETLNRFPGMVKTIRHAFELLRPEEITILRQWREGDDFDYRALLDFVLDRKAGLIPSDRLFIKREKRLRDVAALLLVDLSKSTANSVDYRGTTVLDVEKQAIVLLCEALQKVGDRFAIAGFSGTGPLGVDYYPLKELDEPFTDTVKARIGAMAPQRSTRMGAAIRHATARFASVQARVKLILILGDGFPNDFGYKGTYAVEDTRRAIQEARAGGTFVRAITVNAGDNKQLDRLYGAANHTRIAEIHDLPWRLVRVYTALTRH